jgi:hypothetical protein
MPIDYTLKKRGTFVHAKATGHFTSEDIHAYLDSLRLEPDIGAEHVTLFDATGITSVALEDTGFHETIGVMQKHADKLIAGKVAIVVQNQAYLFYALQYQGASNVVGEQTHIFSTVDEAESWLST